jgi:hypothetical protein
MTCWVFRYVRSIAFKWSPCWLVSSLSKGVVKHRHMHVSPPPLPHLHTFIFCWSCISLQSLANDQLDAFFSCIYLFHLCKFRASQCTSSGDQTMLMHHLVWLVCVSDCLVCRFTTIILFSSIKRLKSERLSGCRMSYIMLQTMLRVSKCIWLVYFCFFFPCFCFCFYQGRVPVNIGWPTSTSKMLHLENGFVWCWNMDASGSRSEIPGKFWNLLLEKDGKDQLDRSCEKWRRVTLSQWAEEYPTWNKKTEG